MKKLISKKEPVATPVTATIPTSAVAEEVTPATNCPLLEQFDALLASEEELEKRDLELLHGVNSTSGAEYWMASRNGVNIFIHACRGTELRWPAVALGTHAKCRVTFPRHGGLKFENDTWTIFARSVELA